MEWWVVLAVSVAGGIGAVLRFVVDAVVTARSRLPYPVGTTVVNLTGSFALGLLTGIAIDLAVPAEWRVILGVGLLGGYTTFSAASFETVRLAEQGRWGAASANGFGMLVGALIAAGSGLWLGTVL